MPSASVTSDASPGPSPCSFDASHGPSNGLVHGPAGPSQLYAVGIDSVNLVGEIGGGVALVGLAAPVGIPVPEPTTMTVVGMGGLMLAMRRRRA